MIALEVEGMLVDGFGDRLAEKKTRKLIDTALPRNLDMVFQELYKPMGARYMTDGQIAVLLQRNRQFVARIRNRRDLQFQNVEHIARRLGVNIPLLFDLTGERLMEYLLRTKQEGFSTSYPLPDEFQSGFLLNFISNIRSTLKRNHQTFGILYRTETLDFENDEGRRWDEGNGGVHKSAVHALFSGHMMNPLLSTLIWCLLCTGYRNLDLCRLFLHPRFLVFEEQFRPLLAGGGSAC